MLKNITLRLDLASIDRVLIRGLVFQSGGRNGDAIQLRPADGAAETPGTTAKANVRIAYCSFDGYKDIAIDCRSSINFPQLLATIDHCLFFDSMPGQPDTPVVKNKLPFVDRGAVNFGSLETPQPDENSTNTSQPQQPNNARVTVAQNAFFKVWRRSPRIANGNFGHIFNNVIYRWGFGNDADPPTNGTNTWRGIEIGGGDGVTGGGDNGSALIEANRFIPWKEKKKLADTITVNRDTIVDIGLSPSTGQPPSTNQPNRFDDPDGNERTVVLVKRTDSDVVFPAPPQGFSFIDVMSQYTAVNLQKPTVTPASAANWVDIVSSSGPGEPRDPTKPENVARQRLLNALTAN